MSLTGHVITLENLKVINYMKKQIMQAREIMGDEAYFGTASLISKIITYEQAMDEISNRKMIEGTRDMRVTWAEFRRMIAAEIYAESREEE